MTVIDPRHPLYGVTFRLVQIEDRPDHGKCCLVERDWGQNSYIPLDVTDKSPTSLIWSRIPLSIQSIRQLVLTYTRLTDDNRDGPTHTLPKASDRNSTQGRLGALKQDTKGTGTPDPDPNLPGPCTKDQNDRGNK